MRRPFLFLLALGLSAVGATCKGRTPESDAPADLSHALEQKEEPVVQQPAISDLEGVDITRIPASSRSDALRILNETFCYCGCARTVASCLANRDTCPCVKCSERVANFVISRYEQGGSTAQIENLLLDVFSEAYNSSPITFDLKDQPIMGPADAPHTIVEFADFRCPHCRHAFAELVTFVQKRKDVRIVYYYFPLSSFGEVSMRAARAAEAARRQGKFWEMAAKIYRYQQALEDSDILGYAQTIGLDIEQFKKDIADADIESSILADRQIGMRLGVSSTPTIYLDGRPLGLRHSDENISLRIDMENDRNACD